MKGRPLEDPGMSGAQSSMIEGCGFFGGVSRLKKLVVRYAGNYLLAMAA